MPSSKYGTIFSFMYTRAGAPPGRPGVCDCDCDCACGVLALVLRLRGSAVGVFPPAPALLGVDSVPIVQSMLLVVG